VIDFGGSELVVGNRDEEEDEVPDEDMPVDDDMEEEFINDQGDVDEDAMRPLQESSLTARPST
jgi:hypothetical protein